FFRRAYDYSAKRPSGFARWPWALARHRGKRHLRNTLNAVRFVKAIDLDLAVPTAFKLGYAPRIIISYRRFIDHAASLLPLSADRTVDVMERDYIRTYQNALVQLHLYGGCVVGFDDLINPDATGWATALAAVTGCCVAKLLAARQHRHRD